MSKYVPVKAVNMSCCNSCPFGGKSPIELAPGRKEGLIQSLLSQPYVHHLCHKEPAKDGIACHGAYVIQHSFFRRAAAMSENEI